MELADDPTNHKNKVMQLYHKVYLIFLNVIVASLYSQLGSPDKSAGLDFSLDFFVAPSSEIYWVCCHLLDDLLLKIRKWICPACRAEHDRGVKAAKKLLRVGRQPWRRRVRPA